MKHIFFLLLLFCSFSVFSQEEKPKEIPFAQIERVPIYPGCKETLSNQDLKKCMSAKISEHVARNFNINIASDLGLPDGKKKIYVGFKINTDGTVFFIKSRAPHPKLEEEAVRVVKLLPKMKPGRIDGEAVIVPYSLPIMFNLESKPLSKKERRRLKRKQKSSRRTS